MFSLYNLFIAVIGGVVPALFWLWFWLREDRLHPEPRARVLICFVAGMVAVPLVLPFQKYSLIALSSMPLVFLSWAAIEEFAKYAAATTAAFRSKDYDEPLDALIYMITAALGFAALENTFFILEPLINGNTLQGLATGNMRFIGASLLHVGASAVLGFFIGVTFFSSVWTKVAGRITGLILAIALHTLFNLFIIRSNGGATLIAFGFVWISMLVVLVLFEKIKRIRKV